MGQIGGKKGSVGSDDARSGRFVPSWDVSYFGTNLMERFNGGTKDTGAYCKARIRLKETFLFRRLRLIAKPLHQQTQSAPFLPLVASKVASPVIGVTEPFSYLPQTVVGKRIASYHRNGILPVPNG